MVTNGKRQGIPALMLLALLIGSTLALGGGAAPAAASRGGTIGDFQRYDLRHANCHRPVVLRRVKGNHISLAAAREVVRALLRILHQLAFAVFVLRWAAGWVTLNRFLSLPWLKTVLIAGRPIWSACVR